MAFVDGPVGSGYRKLSRLDSCLLAAKHSNWILMHDVKRNKEKQTFDYMKNQGWRGSLIDTPVGIGILQRSLTYL
jgi:hypothetical protein